MCAQDKRLYSVWEDDQKLSFREIIYAPRKRDEAALKLYLADIEDFRDHLSLFGYRRIPPRDLADAIERDGVPAFVDRWERIPLFSTQPRLPEDLRARLRAQRMANRPHGLANSLRGMGAGAQTSLWPRLDALTMPALLIAGAEDHKYSEMAAAMADRMPAAGVCIVPDAGHAVHLERPEVFNDRVKEFLSTCLLDHQRLASSPRL